MPETAASCVETTTCNGKRTDARWCPEHQTWHYDGPDVNIREHPEFVPEWDVYRGADGKAVTISDDVYAAIWNAIRVVEYVRIAEGYESMFAANPGQAMANLAKSRLLGRMLMQGRPPTRTKPPQELGACAWWLLDGGDPFDA